MRQAALLWMIALTATPLACKNRVVDVDAGDVGEGEGEGEGEGDGEGEGEGEGDCSPDPVAGLVVPVQDSATFFPICGATVVIQDGAFEETLVEEGVGEDCRYTGAADRPATYEITANAAGYNPFSVSGIAVQPDPDCPAQPTTRTVTVRLVAQ